MAGSFCHGFARFSSQISSVLLGCILLLSSGCGAEGNQVIDSIQWNFLDTKLPSTLSDHTATYVKGALGDEDAVIVLVGGCDSEDGNERSHIYKDLFVCSSVTNATVIFNPFNSTVTTGANAPTSRYRHTAVEIEGEVWVLGGRDLEDNIIETIDVYNPQTDTWSTRGRLPSDLATSDLTAFAHGTVIHVIGGYIANYTALSTVYTFDTAQVGNLTSTEAVTHELKSDMLSARGDIHAVSHFGFAYVTGGFTHANNWCSPLSTMERYHISEDRWELMDSLNQGRADMAIASLNGRIFAIGGEKKTAACEPDPAFSSIPVDDVEMFDPASGMNAEWIHMEDYPTGTFRFPAVAVPAMNSIFTFGGQKLYDPDCDCFPTSNVIVRHSETWMDASKASSSAGRSLARPASLSFALTALFWTVLCYNQLVEN